jgi:hypothetical protein
MSLSADSPSDLPEPSAIRHLGPGPLSQAERARLIDAAADYDLHGKPLQAKATLDRALRDAQDASETESEGTE